MKNVLIVAVIIFQSHLALAACDIPNLEVKDATSFEQENTCSSIKKILSFFAQLGIKSTAHINVIFEDVVYTPATTPEERVLVDGYFDTDDNSVHVTHFKSPSQLQRTPWGLSWSDDIAASIVLHEMTHLVVINSMGDQFRKISHTAHEFIAYSVQFLLMDSTLRDKILKANPNLSAFESPSDVTSMIYELDPNAFGLKAYLTTKKFGDGQFLKRILDQDVVIAGAQ